MTVVISDTSPINYLVLIGEVDLLRRLYQRVAIPDAVLTELRARGSPAAVAAWASLLPAWVEVKLTTADHRDSSLGAGELAVLSLAASLAEDKLLIIDDSGGRREAARLDLRVTGTLGVLRAAAGKRLIDMAAALDKLGRTNFYLPPKLVDFLLEEYRTRKGE